MLPVRPLITGSRSPVCVHRETDANLIPSRRQVGGHVQAQSVDNDLAFVQNIGRQATRPLIGLGNNISAVVTTWTKTEQTSPCVACFDQYRVSSAASPDAPAKSAGAMPARRSGSHSTSSSTGMSVGNVYRRSILLTHFG